MTTATRLREQRLASEVESHEAGLKCGAEWLRDDACINDIESFLMLHREMTTRDFEVWNWFWGCLDDDAKQLVDWHLEHGAAQPEAFARGFVEAVAVGWESIREEVCR